MTITAGPQQATQTIQSQILTECRDYVTAHGNDTETSDYYRLQASVWDILGANPYMGTIDEILHYLNEEAEVDRGDCLPGGWIVSHPEHGPAVSTWKDLNDADIRASLVGLTGQANR